MRVCLSKWLIVPVLLAGVLSAEHAMMVLQAQTLADGQAVVQTNETARPASQTEDRGQKKDGEDEPQKQVKNFYLDTWDRSVRRDVPLDWNGLGSPLTGEAPVQYSQDRRHQALQGAGEKPVAPAFPCYLVWPLAPPCGA